MLKKAIVFAVAAAEDALLLLFDPILDVQDCKSPRRNFYAAPSSAETEVFFSQHCNMKQQILSLPCADTGLLRERAATPLQRILHVQASEED